jgi:hypothetical protein
MSLQPALLRAKAGALATHLLVSAVLVGIALLLIYLCWFPEPLFITDGGGTGLKLVLLVDLVLGPLLTFVVFNPLKARRLMVLDLSIIALLQLVAYGAGLWSIHGVRVQAVALQDGVFHSVAANQYNDQPIEPGSWQRLGEAAPYLAWVRAPKDADEASGVSAFAFMAGLEPYALQFLYEPLVAQQQAVLAQGRRLDDLSPATAERAREWATRHRLDTATLRFYRVEGVYGRAVLVLDDQTRWHGGFRGDLAAAAH